MLNGVGVVASIVSLAITLYLLTRDNPRVAGVFFFAFLVAAAFTVNATTSDESGGDKVKKDPLSGGTSVATPPTGWITLVASLSQADTSQTQALADSTSRTTAYGRPVGVLDSTHYSSINDRYWIEYLGPFTTEADAKTACDDLIGRVAAHCYVKPLVPN
jgi:hypothetical protein